MRNNNNNNNKNNVVLCKRNVNMEQSVEIRENVEKNAGVFHNFPIDKANIKH